MGKDVREHFCRGHLQERTWPSVKKKKSKDADWVCTLKSPTLGLGHRGMEMDRRGEGLVRFTKKKKDGLSEIAKNRWGGLGPKGLRTSSVKLETLITMWVRGSQ